MFAAARPRRSRHRWDPVRSRQLRAAHGAAHGIFLLGWAGLGSARLGSAPRKMGAFQLWEGDWVGIGEEWCWSWWKSGRRLGGGRVGVVVEIWWKQGRSGGGNSGVVDNQVVRSRPVPRCHRFETACRSLGGNRGGVVVDMVETGEAVVVDVWTGEKQWWWTRVKSSGKRVALYRDAAGPIRLSGDSVETGEEWWWTWWKQGGQWWWTCRYESRLIESPCTSAPPVRDGLPGRKAIRTNLSNNG